MQEKTKPVTVQVSDIRWDTDNLAGLPKEVIIAIDIGIDEDESDNEIMDEYVSNMLSDKFGFTHFGFSYVRL